MGVGTWNFNEERTFLVASMACSSFCIKVSLSLAVLLTTNVALALDNADTTAGSHVPRVFANGNNNHHHFSSRSHEELQNAVRHLQMHGGFEICLTTTGSVQDDAWTLEWFSHLPECGQILRSKRHSSKLSQLGEVEQEASSRRNNRRLVDATTSSSWWENSSEKIMNAVGALICISIAALAAGLTLGMLGMDPLMLLIKQRASDNPVEREQASTLLPFVKQHHRLLVTLLLMNAVANEALPIFLEALVPPSVAVLFSVVFVLFFGEIIPSAIFTGPNQMTIASNLTPVVKTAMCLLYPIAMPISSLLDRLLHDEDHDSENSYKRGELAALIRIQYEERMAAKRKRKSERKQHVHSHRVQLLPDDDRIGSLHFPLLRSFREEQRESIRAIKSQLSYRNSQTSQQLDTDAVSSSLNQPNLQVMARTNSNSTHSGPSEMALSVRNDQASQIYEDVGLQRSTSIHIDEIAMVEGALSMKVKIANEVCTPLRRVFSIPDTTVLSEKGVVKIYASGFSRIPVYCDDPDNKKNKKRIIGVLLTKQLIVVNPDDKRLVTSMPLYKPLCVSPRTPLVDLVNLFQT